MKKNSEDNNNFTVKIIILAAVVVLLMIGIMEFISFFYIPSPDPRWLSELESTTVSDTAIQSPSATFIKTKPAEK